jgi:hypothetical protein
MTSKFTAVTIFSTVNSAQFLRNNPPQTNPNLWLWGEIVNVTRMRNARLEFGSRMCLNFKWSRYMQLEKPGRKSVMPTICGLLTEQQTERTVQGRGDISWRHLVRGCTWEHPCRKEPLRELGASVVGASVPHGNRLIRSDVLTANYKRQWHLLLPMIVTGLLSTR